MKSTSKTAAIAGTLALAAAGVWAGVTSTDHTPARPIAYHANPTAVLADHADTYRAQGQTAAADIFDFIAERQTSAWLSTNDLTANANTVTTYTTSAQAADEVATIVLYNIPSRDICAGQSAGGAGTWDNYDAWVENIADTISAAGTGNHTQVILEPDALAGNCAALDAELPNRYQHLSRAIDTLNEAGVYRIYLDAGNSGWSSAAVMAPRLEKAGVMKVRGWVTNVSNFKTVAAEVALSDSIRERLGGHGHYIIDISRNGQGAGGVTPGDWCNPLTAALGQDPRAVNDTSSTLDGLLWVKTVGLSDGSGPECHGGLTAGTFDPDYAQRLFNNVDGYDAPVDPVVATIGFQPTTSGLTAAGTSTIVHNTTGNEFGTGYYVSLGGVASAVSSDANYVSLTIPSPTPGEAWSPSNLTFKMARSGAAAPRGFAISTSMNGFTRLPDVVLSSQRPTFGNYSVNLSQFGSITGDLTIRFHNFAPATTNTVDLDDVVVTSVGR